MGLHDHTQKSSITPVQLPVTPADSVPVGSPSQQRATDILTLRETVDTLTASAIPTGNFVRVGLTFSNVQNDGPVTAVWEVAVFLGSRTTANLFYPRHADCTVSMSLYRVWGPTPTLIDTDGESVATNEELQTLVIENISGSNQDFIIDLRVKYQFNRS